MVILTPILILLVFLGVQSAIYFHAANVATAAASQGAATGAPVGAAPSSVVAAAQRTVTELGGRTAHRPSVTLSDRFVVVSVEVSVSRIVPFFPSSVTRTMLEPRERFIAESKR